MQGLPRILDLGLGLWPLFLVQYYSLRSRKCANGKTAPIFSLVLHCAPGFALRPCGIFRNRGYGDGGNKIFARATIAGAYYGRHSPTFGPHSAHLLASSAATAAVQLLSTPCQGSQVLSGVQHHVGITTSRLGNRQGSWRLN